MLSGLRELPPPRNLDYVLLDKNVKIFREDGSFIPIPEHVLRPHPNHFLVEDSEDGKAFVIRLRDDPMENEENEQPLVQNLELTVFQQYTMKFGYAFQVGILKFCCLLVLVLL